MPMIPEPPPLPDRAALFLDLDGTLIPLALRPDDVQVPHWLPTRLQSLQAELGGALAIISGRSLQAIDALLDPLILPASGAHGAQRRDASGWIELRQSTPPEQLVCCAVALAKEHGALLLELKPAGFAVHFRMDPSLGELCRNALANALAGAASAAQSWELLDGHCVCELTQRSVSKGSAVTAFLREPEFSGRIPIFLGDDTTDEDGIRAVQSAGGFGIRVGAGATEARYRLPDTDAVARWLSPPTADRNDQRADPWT